MGLFTAPCQEYVEGKVLVPTKAFDIFAAGCTFALAGTSEHPFGSFTNSTQIIMRIALEKPSINMDLLKYELPPTINKGDVRDLILKMIVGNHKKRPTASQLHKEIELWLAAPSAPSSVTPTPIPLATGQFTRTPSGDRQFDVITPQPTTTITNGEERIGPHPPPPLQQMSESDTLVATASRSRGHDHDDSTPHSKISTVTMIDNEEEFSISIRPGDETVSNDDMDLLLEEPIIVANWPQIVSALGLTEFDITRFNAILSTSKEQANQAFRYLREIRGFTFTLRYVFERLQQGQGDAGSQSTASASTAVAVGSGASAAGHPANELFYENIQSIINLCKLIYASDVSPSRRNSYILSEELHPLNRDLMKIIAKTPQILLKWEQFSKTQLELTSLQIINIKSRNRNIDGFPDPFNCLWNALELWKEAKSFSGTPEVMAGLLVNFDCRYAADKLLAAVGLDISRSEDVHFHWSESDADAESFSSGGGGGDIIDVGNLSVFGDYVAAENVFTQPTSTYISDDTYYLPQRRIAKGSIGTVVHFGINNKRAGSSGSKGTPGLAIKRSEIRLDQDETWRDNLVMKLNHPNIVRYLSYEEKADEGNRYITMEQGIGSLDDYIEAKFKANSRKMKLMNDILELVDIFKVISDIFSALNFLHDPHSRTSSSSPDAPNISPSTAANMSSSSSCDIISQDPIVHGDIKPENTIIFWEGKQNVIIKLTDFGSLSVVGRSSHPAIVAGTVGYLPKEFIKGEKHAADVNHAAPVPTTSYDIFAAGCTSIYTATGQHPFGNPYERVRNISKHDFTIAKMDTISKLGWFSKWRFRRFLASLISLKPQNRPTAFEALHALQSFSGSSSRG